MGAVTATDDPDDVMKTNMMRRAMGMRRMLMVVRTMMRMMWRRVTVTMRVTMSIRMMMRIDLGVFKTPRGLPGPYICSPFPLPRP